MTGIELCNEYSKRKAALDKEKEMLRSLEETSGLGAQVLDGMPHSHDLNRSPEEITKRKIFLEGRIAAKQRALDDLEADVMTFIDTIEDTETAMILQYRILCGLLWKEVAALISPYKTENAVKIKYSLFIHSFQNRP